MKLKKIVGGAVGAQPPRAPEARRYWSSSSSSISKFSEWPKQLKLLQGPLYTEGEHDSRGSVRERPIVQQ